MDLQSMTTTEKLRAMEELWDSLQASDPKPRTWHGRVLSERQKKMEEEPERYRSLDSVRERGPR